MTRGSFKSKKTKPSQRYVPADGLCVRPVRRSDGTVGKCLLQFDHDMLIWCQDERALLALERLEEAREQVVLLPAVLRLFGLWPHRFNSDDVRAYGWWCAWKFV